MKSIKLIFLITFLLALYIPVVTFDWISKESKEEKRYLAKLPALFNNNIKSNHDFFSQLDEFIGDRFGLRKYLVMFNAEIKYKVLRDIGNREVALGKNGCLCYIAQGDKENAMNDIMKRNLLDKNNLNKAVNSLKNRAQWCKKNNIKYIFLISPEKYSVYPEYFPIKRPEGITLREQITAELEKNGIDYIDPTSYLLKLKNDYPLYLKEDTHWNYLGAYYTFLLLREKIKKEFPKITFPSYEYELQGINKKRNGDLRNLLGIIPYGYDTDVKVSCKGTDLKNLYNLQEIKNIDKGNIYNNIISESSNGASVKAVIFRDSFFYYLEPFVYTMFSRTYARWRTNSMMEEMDKELILKEKPDIVIHEMIERRLINFCNDEYNFEN